MYTKFLAAAVVAASLAAQAAQAVESKAAPSKVDPKDEVVCRLDSSTGTHIPKKICTTRAARDAMAKEDQQKVQNLHGSVHANNPSNR